MTATAHTPRPRPATLATLRQLYTIVLRMQLTPLRLLGVASLGAIGLLLGVLTGRDDDPVRATADLAAGYGITVAIPLCVLWLATRQHAQEEPDRAERGDAEQPERRQLHPEDDRVELAERRQRGRPRTGGVGGGGHRSTR